MITEMRQNSFYCFNVVVYDSVFLYLISDYQKQTIKKLLYKKISYFHNYLILISLMSLIPSTK
jgi:hypothetical protein